jgi:hypothetical protein
MGQKIDLEKNGAAHAAILSAMTGILTIALVNLGTTISAGFKTSVHNLGKLWMPGAAGIGPYSGKETIALVVWLVSWFVFHQVLKEKEWNNGVVFMVFLAGIGIATTLVWPPVFEGIAHSLAVHEQ